MVPGLKVSLDTKFAPGTGAKSGSLKTEYKHDAAMVTADMDLALSAINASAVVGQKVKLRLSLFCLYSLLTSQGWLAGYQTCFDLTKSAVTKSNFGLGYSTSDMVLHTSLTNGADFGGSVFQKLSPNLETGVTLGWSSANTATKVNTILLLGGEGEE